jgi:hypothetical protein
MLIYLSLLFGAAQMFGVNFVNFSPASALLYNTFFMGLFTLLIITIAIIFSLKVFTDYTVSGFSIMRESLAVDEIASLQPTLDIIKADIDNYHLVSILNSDS